ncbi:MAG: hypothetical protein PVJ32_07710 [Anaerolineales bacterium]|jgi:hypothetical protein
MNESRLLPRAPKEYQGSRIALYLLALFAIVGTVRSFIHMLAPDGGAGSIAGIAIGIEGGTNIIAIFGQWGASQLILAVFYWLALLRYRFLVPFMLLTVLIEQFLRIFVGWMKPLAVASPPPGAIGSYVAIPLALIALLLSLRKPSQGA